MIGDVTIVVKELTIIIIIIVAEQLIAVINDTYFEHVRFCRCIVSAQYEQKLLILGKSTII